MLAFPAGRLRQPNLGWTRGQGVGLGSAASLGVGCFPRPCAKCWCLAGLTFIWPVVVCAGGLLGAWGEGVVSGPAGVATGAFAGGGGLLGRVCGGYCLLAPVVWCGGLGGRLVCGGLLCCGVWCWLLFFTHYRGETRRDRVRPSVSSPWVSPLSTPWSGMLWWQRGSGWRLGGSGYPVGWRLGVSFDVMDRAHVVAVVASLCGPVGRAQRTRFSGGVCLRVVVFCVFWGVLRPWRVAELVMRGVFPFRVFVPHPAPVSFPVPVVVALLPSLPRC